MGLDRSQMHIAKIANPKCGVAERSSLEIFDLPLLEAENGTFAVAYCSRLLCRVPSVCETVLGYVTTLLAFPF